MKDVAEAAGVSIATVSHVLNSTRFVSTETTSRVETAIQELRFRANPIARNLRSGKSRLIGFAVSNMKSPFYVEIAAGIEKTIEKYGYRLLLVDSAEKNENERKNIESLYLRGIDGIIIAPTITDCAYLTELLPKMYPLVFVDRRPINYTAADVVLLENQDAAKKTTRYLLEKGRTKIGFVSFHFGGAGTDETIMERLEGFRKAFSEAGLVPDERLIRVVPNVFLDHHELIYAETYHLTKQLLDLNVQAIICGNDLSAIGVFSCLREAGVRIPQDVSLISFDDAFWLSMTSPQITAIVQPSETLGAFAAKQLIRRIQGRREPRKIIRLKAGIIFRGSS
ncbi:MAG: LacI family transcriptional regulator [Treponema sp.]|jgi:LacI family transcriptional regulator|nr:LacI family transcriptional regulator [Treponema sp.]